MTEDRDKSKDGAGLWAGAREGWRGARPAPEAPDPVTLAAYLDGTLDPEAGERVEAWMAAFPDALDLVIAARQVEDPMPAPDALVARAQGLVRARPPARTGFRAWLGDLAGFRVDAWRPVAWAGVTAAMLVVTTGGFELGRMGAGELMPSQTASADDLGFGLGDPADDLL